MTILNEPSVWEKNVLSNKISQENRIKTKMIIHLNIDSSVRFTSFMAYFASAIKLSK